MSDFWKDFPEVATDLERIKARLKKNLDELPSPIRQDLSKLLAYSGKGLRPALVLLAARSGQTTPAVDELATVAELLHLATLVHDDVVDGSPLRRGEASFPAQVGIPKAVLYGDLLFATCFQMVARDVARDNAQAIAKVVATMVGAEIIQQNDLFQPQLSLRRGLRKIMGKTAALLSLCLYAGAVESGQSAEVCRTYRRFGYCLGMAFQLLDDVLDFVSSEKALGKPVLGDLSRGIYSLPVVLALKREALTDGKAPLRKLLTTTKLSSGAVLQAVTLVAQYSGLAQAHTLAEVYTRRALTELSHLPNDPARTILAKVAERLLLRRS